MVESAWGLVVGKKTVDDSKFQLFLWSKREPSLKDVFSARTSQTLETSKLLCAFFTQLFFASEVH
jgi:hypothetical protein